MGEENKPLLTTTTGTGGPGRVQVAEVDQVDNTHHRCVVPVEGLDQLVFRTRFEEQGVGNAPGDVPEATAARRAIVVRLESAVDPILASFSPPPPHVAARLESASADMEAT